MEIQLPLSIRLLTIIISMFSAVFSLILGYWSLLLAAVLLIVSRVACVRNQKNPSRWFEFLELVTGFHAAGILVLMVSATSKMLRLSGQHLFLHYFDIFLITTCILVMVPWSRLWAYWKQSQGKSDTPEEFKS